MKAAANGVLNCSILDGWWVEGYSSDVGWAIGRGESYDDPNHQDEVESMALYDILEKQILPLFYNRGEDNIPREWIARMKNCMRKLVPVFNTNRMVRQYTEQYYIHAMDRGLMMAEDNLARAIELAKVKDSYRQRWHGVKVVGLHTSGNGHYKVGETMQVEALIDLGQFKPEELRVQLVCGVVNPRGGVEDPDILTLQPTREMAPGRHLYTGRIECRSSGRQGYGLRIIPGHRDLATPFEPGLIVWN
jgi:starch phosphorylase